MKKTFGVPSKNAVDDPAVNDIDVPSTDDAATSDDAATTDKAGTDDENVVADEDDDDVYQVVFLFLTSN